MNLAKIHFCIRKFGIPNSNKLMTTKQLDRVVFYSKDDLSAGYHLKKAERLLNNLELTTTIEVNDLLELYNVKEYFDNNLFLLTWDDTLKSAFSDKILQADKKIKEIFLAMNDDNIIASIESLESDYRATFWHLFNYYQAYKRITKEAFSEALKLYPQQSKYILTKPNTVNYFDEELRKFMMTNEDSAELLLSKFEQGDRSRNLSYVFPKSLSIEDKEKIILDYILQEKPNLNYIRLIEHSKDSNDLKFSVKTRLEAKKKSEELNNKIFNEGISWQIGVLIKFDQVQDEPVISSYDGKQLDLSYSVKFLDGQQNDVARFMLFKNLFGFTDHIGLITLYNRQSEMDIFERVLMKSKNGYPEGLRFIQKKQVARAQIAAFNHYLQQKETSLEQVIQSFIHLKLNKEFRLDSLQFKFPTINSTFLEKIRLVAPELESLLKQYQVYSQEGKIDFELIQIDSNPLKFSDVKSLLEKKYVYATNEKTTALEYYFYSDQSSLQYVEPFKDKYSNLYDLLENEDVKFENFADFQQGLIKQLISEGYLFQDIYDNVKMTDDVLIYLIGELHRDGVLSYWHYPKEVRDLMDEMEKNNLIRFGNTLFSEPELSYYNYYLNMKGYTNGLNIRNKYLHGSNSSSEKVHEYEYYILIQLTILALLKIVDDLSLRSKIDGELKSFDKRS